MRILREILPPLLFAYAVFVSVVIAAWRRPRGLEPPVPRTRDLVVTIAGGFLVFLAIVAVFHVWLLGDSGALRSALAGGGTLLAIALVAFAILSWVERRLTRRRR